MNHKKGDTPSNSEMIQAVKNSWDNNVLTRSEDLEQGTDYSYLNYITPWVLNHVLGHSNTNSIILDIGCGCGYLTNAVFRSGRHNIKGIDISPKSVECAQNRYPSIVFECNDIYDLPRIQTYDICLAIMLLNNMAEIEFFFPTIRDILKPGGKLLLVIPHPCFWPSRHLDCLDFSYKNEAPYSFQFATKNRRDYPCQTLYFHRTIETYIHSILDAGLKIISIQEISELPFSDDPDILGLELAR